MFAAVSLAALKNKPSRFIRQVIRSKYFILETLPRFLSRRPAPIGRGFPT
jgi:hypothetical protein